MDLAFSSNIADTLEIYALDGRGRIHHRWWWRDQGWSEGWAPMDTPGGRPVTAIAAGPYADYHQELFAIVDGESWHRWYWADRGWSGWSSWEDFPVPDGSRLTDPSGTGCRASASPYTRALPRPRPGRNRCRGYVRVGQDSTAARDRCTLGSEVTVPAVIAVEGLSRSGRWRRPCE
jgi:hypothetical protein